MTALDQHRCRPQRQQRAHLLAHAGSSSACYPAAALRLPAHSASAARRAAAARCRIRSMPAASQQAPAGARDAAPDRARSARAACRQGILHTACTIRRRREHADLDGTRRAAGQRRLHLSRDAAPRATRLEAPACVIGLHVTAVTAQQASVRQAASVCMSRVRPAPPLLSVAAITSTSAARAHALAPCGQTLRLDQPFAHALLGMRMAHDIRDHRGAVGAGSVNAGEPLERQAADGDQRNTRRCDASIRGVAAVPAVPRASASAALDRSDRARCNPDRPAGRARAPHHCGC